jgi:predicted RNA-binding Zn-ribbon protein involved in translation (DUF1610 family)
MKDCPHCHKRNQNDASFCWDCGKRLDEESTSPLLRPHKCPNCGEKILDEEGSCRYCQYDLSASAPVDGLRAREESTTQEPDEEISQAVGEKEAGEKYDSKTMSEDFILVGLMIYGVNRLVGYIVTLMSDTTWGSPGPPSQVIGSYIFAIIPSIWLARKITINRTAYILLTLVFSEVFLFAFGLIIAVIEILFNI